MFVSYMMVCLFELHYIKCVGHKLCRLLTIKLTILLYVVVGFVLHTVTAFEGNTYRIRSIRRFSLHYHPRSKGGTGGIYQSAGGQTRPTARRQVQKTIPEAARQDAQAESNGERTNRTTRDRTCRGTCGRRRYWRQYWKSSRKTSNVRRPKVLRQGTCTL